MEKLYLNENYLKLTAQVALEAGDFDLYNRINAFLYGVPSVLALSDAIIQLDDKISARAQVEGRKPEDMFPTYAAWSLEESKVESSGIEQESKGAGI